MNYSIFNGNLLVAKKGKIIYQKSFGFADYYSERLLNDSSVFELASISKQFTAMGILILIERGQMQLTDSLRQYFPELPYKGISINHLLTHTSGLPDYEKTMTEKWDHSKIAFNNDMINFLIIEKLPIHFNPGEKCEYSNTGYALLASIIEKVSGKSYKDFMAENIFRPLKMSHSLVYNMRRSSNEKIPNYAYGFVFSDSLNRYVLPDSLPKYQVVYFLDGIQGDGCVNSTTGDLLKWDRALKNCTLVTKETITKMLTPHALLDTMNKIYYGYGLMIGKDDLGSFIAHSGGWPGYSTYYLHYPNKDISLFVLSNNEAPSSYISNSLAYIVSKKSIIMPYNHKFISLDSTAIDRFTGSFKSKSGFIYKLTRQKDRLYFESPSGISIEFKPESINKVYSTNKRDLQFEFEKDFNGEVKYFQILYGIKSEIEKLN